MIYQRQTPIGTRTFRIHLKRPDKNNIESRGLIGFEGVAAWIKKNGTENVKKITHQGGPKLKHEEMLLVMGHL